MKRIASRVERAASRWASVEAQQPPPEIPATVTWLSVIQVYWAHYERMAPFEGRDVILERLRKSIAFLERFNASPTIGYWQSHLEYFCHGCLVIFSCNTPQWEGKNLWFLYDEYETSMNRIIEGIEAAASEAARVTVDVSGLPIGRV